MMQLKKLVCSGRRTLPSKAAPDKFGWLRSFKDVDRSLCERNNVKEDETGQLGHECKKLKVELCLILTGTTPDK